MHEELKGLLLTLLAKVDGIETRLDGIDTRLDVLAAEQTTFKESQLRMEGQMSVLILWLQSVNRRTHVLMAPAEQPAA